MRNAMILVAWAVAGGTAALLAQPEKPALDRPRVEPAPRPGAAAPADPAAPAPPGQAAPQPDGVVRFDVNRAEVRYQEGRWILVAGETFVKDFGDNSTAARLALNSVRWLNLNELAWVGQPQPSVEFFLANGRAPEGLIGSAVDLVGFAPERLVVKQQGDVWWLADAQRLLLPFADHKEHAERTLALIRQYHFNQVAFLERPPAPLVLFLHGAANAHRTPTMEPVKLHPIGKLSEPERPAPAGNPVAAPAEPPPPGTRLAFDYRQVQVRKDAGHWLLAAGRTTLKDFGTNEQEAREALRLFQFYRFTERYQIGEGETVFEYYLATGQAPRGRMLGQASLTFDARKVRAQERDGGWVLLFNEQPLGRVATRAQADQALAVLRKYQFDQVGYLGRPTPVLTYFAQGR
jgi:hypothetical protein